MSESWKNPIRLSPRAESGGTGDDDSIREPGRRKKARKPERGEKGQVPPEEAVVVTGLYTHEKPEISEADKEKLIALLGDIPGQITKKVRAELKGKGYQEAEIRELTTLEAHYILNKEKLDAPATSERVEPKTLVRPSGDDIAAFTRRHQGRPFPVVGEKEKQDLIARGYPEKDVRKSPIADLVLALEKESILPPYSVEKPAQNRETLPKDRPEKTERPDDGSKKIFKPGADELADFRKRNDRFPAITDDLRQELIDRGYSAKEVWQGSVASIALALEKENLLPNSNKKAVKSKRGASTPQPSQPGSVAPSPAAQNTPNAQPQAPANTPPQAPQNPLTAQPPVPEGDWVFTYADEKRELKAKVDKLVSLSQKDPAAEKEIMRNIVEKHGFNTIQPERKEPLSPENWRESPLCDQMRQEVMTYPQFMSAREEYAEKQKAFFSAKEAYMKSSGTLGNIGAMLKRDWSGASLTVRNARKEYENASQKASLAADTFAKKRLDAKTFDTYSVGYIRHLENEARRANKPFATPDRDTPEFKRGLESYVGNYQDRVRERYRGLVLNRDIIRDAAVGEHQVLQESFKNREQMGAERALKSAVAWYQKQPTWKKVLVGTAVGALASAGIGGALGAAGIGGGVALGILGKRALVRGLSIGTGLTAAVSRTASRAGDALGKRFGEGMATFFGKKSRAEAIEGIDSIGKTLREKQETKEQIRAKRQEYLDLMSAEDKIAVYENRIKTATQVAIGAAVGAGTYYAADAGLNALEHHFGGMAGVSEAVDKALHQSGIPEAAASTEAVVASHEPISVTVGEGKGMISMFSDLKEKLVEQYPDPSTAPEVVKHVLETSDGDLAQEYGGWNTAADAPGGTGLESAKIELGSTLEVNDHGELVFTQGGDHGQPFIFAKEPDVYTGPTIERNFNGDFTDGNASLKPEIAPETGVTPDVENVSPQTTPHVHTPEETARWAAENRLRNMIKELPPSLSVAATDSPEYARELSSFLETAASHSPQHAHEAAQFIAANQGTPSMFEALAKGVKHLTPDASLKEALINDTSHASHLYLLKNGEYAVFNNPDQHLSVADTYSSGITAAKEAAKQTGQNIHVPDPEGNGATVVYPSGETREYGTLFGNTPKSLHINNAVLEVPKILKR